MLFFLTLLPIVAASDLRAIPFGQSTHVETLIARHTPAVVNRSPYKQTNDAVAPPSNISQEHTTDDANSFAGADFIDDDESHSDLDVEPEEEEEDDYNEFGHYHPIGATADQTLVRRAGLEKRAIYRGVMQMDCLISAEACQNACWYQNCIRAGLPTEYVEGGFDKNKATANRVQAGVTVTYGRPCRTWPFSQKFWDTYQFQDKPKGNHAYLETDEWPMAAMENAAFDSAASPAQRSLRCITGNDNDKGGNQLSRFRRAEGDYKEGGKWEHHRLGSKRPFNIGDTYHVAFNFEHFEQGNPEHDNLRKLVSYCEGDFAGCKNDGRQFSLTNLRYSSDKQNSGYLGWPYDNTKHNTYRLGTEDEDVKQYHVSLSITGLERDQVTASVGIYNNGPQIEESKVMQTIDSKTLTLDIGDSFTLQGNGPLALKRALTVTRTDQKDDGDHGCEIYDFQYGSKEDGYRAFRFRNNDVGYGQWSHTKGAKTAKYCEQSVIREQKRKADEEEPKVIGTLFKCSFPGW